MPDYGQTITKGIKFIRVNNFDKGGRDNSTLLNVIDSIRISPPGEDSVEYKIITTQKQENSYLYGVIPNEISSSLNLVKNYDMVLDLAGVGPTLSSGIEYFQWNNGLYGSGYVMGVISGNSENAYASDGSFSFTLPNVETSITSSIRTGTLSGNVTWSPFLIPVTQAKFFDVGVTNGPGMVPLGDPVTLSNNFTTYTTETLLSNIPGGIYYFAAVFNSAGSWQILDSGLEVNQVSSNPSVSPSLINFTPPILNFNFSDYNAIIGNVSNPQFSNIFQDVDYSDNYITPINFELISNGTAQKAFVQDSNYSQVGWSNGRYNGSRNSSRDFNK